MTRNQHPERKISGFPAGQDSGTMIIIGLFAVRAS